MAPEDLACRDLVEMVTDYLDGVLPPEQASLVAGHLELCPGCAEYLAQMRSTVTALGGLPVELLDPAVTASLLQAFRDFPRGGQVSARHTNE